MVKEKWIKEVGMITFNSKGKDYFFDWYVVSIDETEDWLDEIKAKCEKLFTVYLVNKGEITHCCSLEGSYWLEPLYFDYIAKDNATDEDLDWLDNQINEVSLFEQGNYYSENYKFDKEIPVNEYFTIELPGFNYDESYEKLKEYLMCNHIL